MKRIVLISNDRIRTQMAGPAMRYYQFAKELSRSAHVSLVVPVAPDFEIDFADVIPMPKVVLRGGLRSLARSADVIVCQERPPREARILARTDAKLIYDLYDPIIFEALPQYAEEPTRWRTRAMHRYVSLIQSLALATGDAFICASERQRDLWLGILAALGRIDVDVYRADPSLHNAVGVVPFGLEHDPPRATRRTLKGVVPGISDSDHVLLWGGGVWNWLDPLTVIRAVAEISKSREDVKLYFLGMKHPNPRLPEMAMATRAVELAHELEVEGRFVFFNHGWVPYHERQNFLLEADVGMSAHFDNVETRYAFRTRLLDYFWAGLPTLTSPGDVLAELVGEANLGRVVGFEDVTGWADAIVELVDDAPERQRIRDDLVPIREEFCWPNVVGRLDRLAAAPNVLSAAPRRTLWMGGTVVRRGALDVVGDGYRLARSVAADGVNQVVRHRSPADVRHKSD